jgi:hypothetical protein
MQGIEADLAVDAGIVALEKVNVHRRRTDQSVRISPQRRQHLLGVPPLDDGECGESHDCHVQDGGTAEVIEQWQGASDVLGQETPPTVRDHLPAADHDVGMGLGSALGTPRGAGGVEHARHRVGAEQLNGIGIWH